MISPITAIEFREQHISFRIIIIRLYAQQAFKFSSCLLMTLELVQGDAAIIQGVSIVGPNRQRTITANERVLMTLELVQGNAAIVKSLNIVGLDR